MTKNIVSYQDAVHSGPAIVGGKGWNLARLQRYGFLVPEGAILSAHVYTQFMQHPTLNALRTELADVQPTMVTDTAVDDVLHTLRMTIEATELPIEVEQAVQTFLTASHLADVPVAVRSSATSEDGTTASFAGMHESFLHVTGSNAVLQAIKRCYASLWTPRALAYRRHHGFSDKDVACAVVICSMVTGTMQDAPVAAGVAFSCDPRTGQRDRVTINAAPGWGVAVVSGHVTPEEITVIAGSNGRTLQIQRAKEQPQVLTDAQVRPLPR